MLYPAKLPVVAHGSVHFFENLTMATNWHERQLRQLFVEMNQVKKLQNLHTLITVTHLASNGALRDAQLTLLLPLIYNQKPLCLILRARGPSPRYYPSISPVGHHWMVFQWEFLCLCLFFCFQAWVDWAIHLGVTLLFCFVTDS